MIFLFYHTYVVWVSNVIVKKKKNMYFCLIFSKYLKAAKMILLIKIFALRLEKLFFQNVYELLFSNCSALYEKF